MGRMGGFNLSELKKLQKSLNKIEESQVNEFIEACAKELTGRLLNRVKKRTPVGEYSGGNYKCKAKVGDGREHQSNKQEGKEGGTLRRGWTIGEIKKEGSDYKIEIINPVEYASYVEYGHRKSKKGGWVDGHFMMTIAEQEINQIAPKVLENKIKKFLGGAFK